MITSVSEYANAVKPPIITSVETQPSTVIPEGAVIIGAVLSSTTIS